MLAAIYRRFGPALETIELADWDVGEPGDGEALVDIEAAPVHFGDLLYVEGRLSTAPPPPAVAGSEGIGRIAALGPGVAGLSVGQRVWLPRKAGAFARRLRFAATRLVPAPEHGDPLQLALVPVNALTSWLLVTRVVALGPGEWLLQNAANSSCGRYLIRLARLKGVRTVNVVRRPEMVQDLLDLGGDVVLVDGPDLAARVAAAVGGAPVKLGIDAVAGAATQRIAECLAPGSTVASYGSMTNQRCELDFYLMFRNDIRLVGVAFVRQFALKRTPQQVREMYARLADLMARGELVAKIAGVYTLDQVVEACARAGRTGADRDGKVILKIG